MAQYVLNAYDADIFIPEFKGLMQYGDQMGTDLRYSPDCMNVETPGGVLQPSPLMSSVDIIMPEMPNPVSSSLPPIPPKHPAATHATLMHLHEEFTETVQPTTGSPGEIRAGGGNVVFITEVNEQTNEEEITGNGIRDFDTFLISHYWDGATSGDETNINNTLQMRIRGDPMEIGTYNNVYPIKYNSSIAKSWCTYEASDTNGTYNILLCVHENDGLYAYCSKQIIVSNSITVPAFEEYKITTPTTPSFVARYAERIWIIGSGDTKHVLYYSKPYSAFDWDQNNDYPENGGGMISEPTWDSDKIVALVPFGDSLIVFSELRAWKITGTDPRTFNIQEQYGNGTKFPDTIAVMNNQIIMMTDDGLSVYDGYQTRPFLREQTYDILKGINYGSMKATVYDRKYILATSEELSFTYFYPDINELGSHVTHTPINIGKGYRTIVYDEVTGSVTQMQTPKIMSFCKGTPYILVQSDMYSLRMARLRFDSWERGTVTTNPVKWTSPWITLGRQDIQKGGFELYFTPEIKPKTNIDHQLWEEEVVYGDEINAPNSVFKTSETSGSVDIKFSIQTEKKTKTKTYTVVPLTSEEITAGKKYKMKRLHFGGSGRRFRLIIEVASGNTIPWRLVGGIHIIAETDKD